MVVLAIAGSSLIILIGLVGAGVTAIYWASRRF